MKLEETRFIKSINHKNMTSIEYVDSANLIFDDQNPRMVEFGANQYSEEQLINLLWREMAVEELVMSILALGFFDH